MIYLITNYRYYYFIYISNLLTDYEIEEDKKIKNFRDNIFNDDIIKDLIDNKKDFIQQDKNITYQITTSDNQKNNSNNNISSINLGTCEDILKDKYNIDKNLPLIIFKIDYYSPDTLIPIVGYEVYHPINKSRLDLIYCKDILIKLNIPTSIDENNLFKYDPNSGFYNDNRRNIMIIIYHYVKMIVNILNIIKIINNHLVNVVSKMKWILFLK